MKCALLCWIFESLSSLISGEFIQSNGEIVVLRAGEYIEIVGNS